MSRAGALALVNLLARRDAVSFGRNRTMAPARAVGGPSAGRSASGTVSEEFLII